MQPKFVAIFSFAFKLKAQWLHVSIIQWLVFACHNEQATHTEKLFNSTSQSTNFSSTQWWNKPFSHNELMIFFDDKTFCFYCWYCCSYNELASIEHLLHNDNTLWTIKNLKIWDLKTTKFDKTFLSVLIPFPWHLCHVLHPLVSKHVNST